MDDQDRQLLGYLRKGIPFSARPFEEIGRKVGTDGADVLLRLTRFKERRVTGPLTAVLDSKNLGYQSTWAALQLPDSGPAFESAAARVNEHPGVFRSHRRFHIFNFWFTLMLPPSESIEEHLKVLQEVSGAAKGLAFPAAEPARPFQIFPAEEINVLRALQEDLQLADEPFRKPAKDCGMDEKKFLETARKFEKQGIIRRLGVLFPAERQPAAAQNMIAWQVPEEKQDTAAAKISRVPGVVRCMKRTAHPEFPHGLFAFYSAGTEELDRIIFDIEEEIGKWPWVHIPVAAELKNSRPKYFPKELEKWCAKAAKAEVFR